MQNATKQNLELVPGENVDFAKAAKFFTKSSLDHILITGN